MWETFYFLTPSDLTPQVAATSQRDERLGPKFMHLRDWAVFGLEAGEPLGYADSARRSTLTAFAFFAHTTFSVDKFCKGSVAARLRKAPVVCGIFRHNTVIISVNVGS